jgi:hypothetical protein
MPRQDRSMELPCKLCGKLGHEHTLCSLCTIAIGRGHLETKLMVFEGRKVCEWCYYNLTNPEYKFLEEHEYS